MAGEPGWVGDAVRVQALDEEGEPKPLAWVRLVSGVVISDNADLLEKWTQEGIVGRASQGRLYPRDGQKFLDELPYHYKSPYCWAEPAARS